jgi:hypothetical protein
MLSNYNGVIPNFPNYNLLAWQGSPCDTLLSLTPYPSPFGEGLNASVFPNPVSDEVFFSYRLPQNRSGTLEIYNTIGERVFFYYLPPWSSVQRFSFSNLQKGVYTVKVTSGASKGVNRMVKL